MLRHLDTVKAKFEGQCHWSKFVVTGGKFFIFGCRWSQIEKLK